MGVWDRLTPPQDAQTDGQTEASGGSSELGGCDNRTPA